MRNDVDPNWELQVGMEKNWRVAIGIEKLYLIELKCAGEGSMKIKRKHQIGGNCTIMVEEAVWGELKIMGLAPGIKVRSCNIDVKT